MLDVHLITNRLSTIKDTDQVFVMGDGVVLEQGTHNGLLLNPNGLYATFVKHKLHEEDQKEESDSNHGNVTKVPSTPASEKVNIPTEDTEPLKRTVAGTRSLASGVISTHEKKGAHYDQKNHSLIYLSKHMGRISWDS